MSNPIFHLLAGVPTPVAPYSHAVQVGDWLLVTGQLPIDPAREGDPLPEGIEAQTQLTFANLERVLAAVDYRWEHVVSARVFLTRFQRDYEAMNRVYESYFASDRRPARTCVGVTDLARDALVEIDLIAYRAAQ